MDRPRHRARGRRLQRWALTAWLGPSLLLLILAVILFPAIEMVNTSLQSMDIAGVSHGYVGLDNYRRLFAEPALISPSRLPIPVRRRAYHHRPSGFLFVLIERHLVAGLTAGGIK